MYKVTSDLKLKVQGTIKMFPAGSLINLPEKSAQMLIHQGKLVPVFEPVDDLSERMAIQGENCEPGQTKPYITNFGVLVIPFNSDPRYHYWRKGGQSICRTLQELGRCDLIPKYKSPYSDN